MFVEESVQETSKILILIAFQLNIFQIFFQLNLQKKMFEQVKKSNSFKFPLTGNILRNF